MITPQSIKLLEELSRTQHGRALREFLDEKYVEIGNIMESKSWEETLGRQFALNLLKDLFAFMEEKKHTEKTKNQYVWYNSVLLA